MGGIIGLGVVIVSTAIAWAVGATFFPGMSTPYLAGIGIGVLCAALFGFGLWLVDRP